MMYIFADGTLVTSVVNTKSDIATKSQWYRTCLIKLSWLKDTKVSTQFK